MEYPRLGESVANGEAIVIAKRRAGFEGAGGRPWFVLAMFKDEPDDDDDCYLVGHWLGDGRIADHVYFRARDFVDAAVGLENLAGGDTVVRRR